MISSGIFVATLYLLAQMPEGISFDKGAMSAMLGWFMFRFEKYMRDLIGAQRTTNHRIDGMNGALLVQALSHDGPLHPAVRKQAEVTLADINARDRELAKKS